MVKDNFYFWYKCLLWINILTLMIGVLIAVAGSTFIFDFHNRETQILFNDNIPLPDQTQALKNWLFGIIGGTMVGFNILAIFIIKFAFKDRKRWAWYALFTGITVWFVIDSAVSAFYQAYYNIYTINILALLSYYIPLFFSYRYFKK